jgi:SAM-dependent methyltransferase
MTKISSKMYKILAKFALLLNNFSYRWCTKFAIKAEGGLHPKHRLMDYHKFFMDNVRPNDMVLDIGCGNGSLTYDIAKKAKKVTGIDLNGNNMKIAQKVFSSPNIEYVIGDATTYDFDKNFDVIILSNVLEHIDYRIEFLKKMVDIAPKILIRVPMITRDWLTLYKKELGIEWRLDPTHYTEYTLESLSEELHKAGLEIENASIQFGEIWVVGKK